MSKKTKDKNKGIGGLLVLFCWLLFILLALLFYFYFKDDLENFNSKKQDNISTEASTEQAFETVYSYQTNANLDINALMIEYYAALSVCDQQKLQSLVMDPSQFNDMTDIQRKAQAISKYSNINCYTLPGYTDDATVVYVICNLSINNVSSSPLDITQFYVLNTADGYKIDNRSLEAPVAEYITQQNENKDIQNLYQTVVDNINLCIESDPSFAEFYNTINQSK